MKYWLLWFGVVVGFTWGCDDDPPSEAPTETEARPDEALVSEVPEPPGLDTLPLCDPLPEPPVPPPGTQAPIVPIDGAIGVSGETVFVAAGRHGEWVLHCPDDRPTLVRAAGTMTLDGLVRLGPRGRFALVRLDAALHLVELATGQTERLAAYDPQQRISSAFDPTGARVAFVDPDVGLRVQALVRNQDQARAWTVRIPEGTHVGPVWLSRGGQTVFALSAAEGWREPRPEACGELDGKNARPSGEVHPLHARLTSGEVTLTDTPPAVATLGAEHIAAVHPGAAAGVGVNVRQFQSDGATTIPAECGVHWVGAVGGWALVACESQDMEVLAFRGSERCRTGGFDRSGRFLHPGRPDETLYRARVWPLEADSIVGPEAWVSLTTLRRRPLTLPGEPVIMHGQPHSVHEGRLHWTTLDGHAASIAWQEGDVLRTAPGHLFIGRGEPMGWSVVATATSDGSARSLDEGQRPLDADDAGRILVASGTTGRRLNLPLRWVELP